MRYSIIDTEKGEQQRLYARLHRTLKNGTKMIVNENELLKIGSDVEAVAKKLGGTLLTNAEVDNEIKKLSYE